MAGIENIVENNFYSDLIRQVRMAKEEASQDGWYGDQSKAVSQSTYDCACNFVRVIPSKFPSPEVTAEPDGWINFEWYPDKWKKVSISSFEKVLGYCAFLGSQDNNTRGVINFDGTFPSVCEEFLEKIYSYEG